MTARRMVWLPLAILGLLACLALSGVVRSTAPATKAEISDAIRRTDPACQSLLKERLRAYIVEKGAISRRSVDTISHLECKVSGPQYEAAGG